MRTVITRLRSRTSRIAFVMAITMAAAGAVPELSEFEVGNVSTTAFCVCWETSELSNPNLEVFSDLAGTQSLAGQVKMEFFPLTSDQRAVASSVVLRAEGRSLRDEIRMKNVVLVKVSGLQPGTDYFARPIAVDGGGGTVSSGAMQAITTAQTVSFVNESRRVLVDLTTIDNPGSEVLGGLLVITTPNARYPLISVIGDSVSPTQGYADLTHFLTAAGDENLLPAGIMELSISWKGIPEVPGMFGNNMINYGVEPVVAETSLVDFIVEVESIEFNIVLRKTPPVVGLPQDLLLSAEDGGIVLMDYDRTASLESTGTLIAGGGSTAPFVDGVLFEHSVVFGTAGMVDLTLRDLVGPSSTTIQINVLPLTYDNWRVYYFGSLANPDGDPDADPEGDGLNNAGEYTTLRDPLRRDGDVLNVVMTPSGLKAWIDFNRFQSEYVIAFDTTLNLQTWIRSAIGPSLQESLSGRDIMEAVFPLAEFGNAPFGGVRAVFELDPGP